MLGLHNLVGMGGFEPPTFRPPDERSTRLSHIPKLILAEGGRIERPGVQVLE